MEYFHRPVFCSLNFLGLEVFDTLDPIFEIGKGFCVYHQFCREILEALFAHGHHTQLREIFNITGAVKAQGILILTENDCIGASVSHMTTDNPDGNLSVFFAYFFFGRNAPIFTDGLIAAGLSYSSIRPLWKDNNRFSRTSYSVH